MLNGYRPVVPHEYVTQIFDGFGSVNVGELSTDAQLADLRRRGVEYVLLHEDAFPRKSARSPWPLRCGACWSIPG